MNLKSLVLPLTLLAGGLTSSTTHAQILWGKVNTISASSDISLNGTYVDAAGNFQSGGSTSVAVGSDTVVFHNLTYNSTLNTYSDGSHITLSNIVADNGGDSYTGSASLNVDYATAIAGCAYTGNGDPQHTGTVTLSGLVEGQSYEVEVWQSRTNDPSRDTTFTSDGGNSASTTGGDYIIGTFVAEGTSQMFTFTGSTGELNALELRATPEPSSVAFTLAGLGCLALVVHRRRLASRA